MLVHVRLLGPVIVELDGRPLEIHQPLELALVARLALEPARVVAGERLIDDLWGERLPRNPLASLQSLVYRSRRSLDEGSTALRRAGNGYLLAAEPEQVDSSRFESLVTRARRATPLEDPQVRRTALREALALWNGPALAGLDVPFVVSQRPGSKRRGSWQSRSVSKPTLTAVRIVR